MNPEIKAKIERHLTFADNMAADEPAKTSWALGDAISLLMQEVERLSREVEAQRAK